MKQLTGRSKNGGQDRRLPDQGALPLSLADAQGHARILIESHGRRNALLIAQTNASLASDSRYWAQVLLAVFRSGFSEND